MGRPVQLFAVLAWNTIPVGPSRTPSMIGLILLCPPTTIAMLFSRYMVRMDEIEQSLRIIEQALATIPDGDHIIKGAPKPKWSAPKGEAYFAVEGSKGKVGVWVVSDGGKMPYRVKLRAPSFCNLSLFAEASQGVLLADAVSILGSLDLVIPEIDR